MAVMRGGIMKGGPMLSVMRGGVMIEPGDGEEDLGPLVLWLGPSTAAQGFAPFNNQMRQQSISPIKRAYAVRPNFRCPNWYDATRPDDNGGFVIATDGWTMSHMLAQVPYIAASEATDVIVETGRNDIPNMSAAAYVTEAQALIQAIQAISTVQRVWWPNLWMRTTGSGTGWGSGETNRTRLLQINTDLTTWCNANGVGVIDLFETLTDGSDPDDNPLAGVTRTDGVHYAPYGANLAGNKIASDLIAQAPSVFLATSIYDPAPAGSMVPPMSGSGGTAGSGVSGTIPDGWTVSRSSVGTPATVVTCSDYTDGTGDYLNVEIDASAVVEASGEQVSISLTNDINGFEVGKWYRARAYLYAADGSSGDMCGIPLYFGEDTPEYSIAMMPVNDGGSAVTGNDANALIEPQFEGILETEPWQFGTTQGVLGFRLRTFGPSTMSIYIKKDSIDVREVEDPTALFGPVITSANTEEVASAGALALLLTASKSVTWAIIGGADQAQFSLAGSTLEWSGATPAEGDYVVIVRATDANGKTATQTITVTVLAAENWTVVGGNSNIVTATSGNITLVKDNALASETFQAGDLFLAILTMRDLPEFANADWTEIQDHTSVGNTTSGATTSVSNVQVFYHVYNGSVMPSLVFTRTSGSVAQGIWTVRRCGGTPVLDASSYNTLGAASVTATTGTITTTEDNCLIVAAIAGARNETHSAFDAATDPATASGTADATSEPTEGTWIERRDIAFATAPAVSLAFADAVKQTAGATGQIQVTSSLSAQHSMIAAAFRIT